MKLKTKVEIANSLAKEKGGKPALTMNQLMKELAPLKARSREKMRELIAKKLFNE